MALQRFFENYSFGAKDYSLIRQSHTITESEIAIAQTQKLSEGTKKYLEELNTNIKGKTVWRVPVSRYDWKNANGRVYEKRLWQHVIDSQKDVYQGGVGLADHPDDDKEGKFKEIGVVWLNMGLNESDNDDEKIVWAECIFVGENGHLAEEILDAGGRVGFSSSGFGELDESDKATVRWDTYILERVSDMVLNPSQKVYGRKENIVRKESIDESLDTQIDEKAMNPKTGPKLKKCKVCGHEFSGSGELCPDCKDRNIKQENTTMAEDSNFKMSKHEIRRFREDVTHYLGEIAQEEDLQEKVRELEEIRSYFSPNVAPDLLAEVDKQIEEAHAAIDAAVKEHSKIVKTFGVATTEELKEGVKRMAIDGQLFERDVSDWKKIATGLQEKVTMLQEVLATRPTVEAYKKLIIDMKSLKDSSSAETKKYVEYIESLKSKIAGHTQLENQLISELEIMNTENSKLREYASELKNYGLKMKEKLSMYREEKASIETATSERLRKEEEVSFRPQGDSKLSFAGFNESDDVAEYYENLKARYGKTITPYQEKILNCKTVREAMIIFNKIFASSGSVPHISEALDVEERKKLIEGTIGVKIKNHSNLDSRLPDTWS